MQRQRATWMMKRVSGHGPGSRAARWKTGGSYSSNPTARRCARRLTHRLHAHELPTRAERRVLGLGGSQVRRPTRHSPGQAQQLRGLAHLPRIPLQAVLIQWAAKVAFFKLKLDQLMDSLCRVCLAESKQNL